MSFFWGLIAALAGNSIIGLGNCLQKYALTRGTVPTSHTRQVSNSSDTKFSSQPLLPTTTPVPGTYSRFKDRTWLMGISSVYLGELCGNWVALSLIPASVVTPLGILGVVVNAILAKFLLDEQISFRQTKGYIWILSGVLTTILFSATTVNSIENHLKTTSKLFFYMTRLHVILWLITILVIQCILIMMVRARKGKSSLVLYVIMTAGFGSLTVVASKFLALLLKVWVFAPFKPKLDENASMLALIFSFLVIIFTLIIGIIGQETCKQLALNKYRVTQFQPMFYASHVTFVALSGMIVFEEVGAWWSVIGFCLGIIAILRGALFLLHSNIEEKIGKQIKKAKEKSLD
ncbi:magnesium transporter NIPA-domain-containing protein [Glomus cerebriforme]|uniref:Magnesium transporter NIPA-domain-containing protein n=1 Tax=Glomus cerebriforme TaxID=658196 RepID=A0A397TK16_9GLOM|nr:magnesium transporter NIPA-domain-containing protein [Glomus cerebriforme]